VVFFVFCYFVLDGCGDAGDNGDAFSEQVSFNVSLELGRLLTNWDIISLV